MEEKHVSQYAEKMPTEAELRQQREKRRSAYLDGVEYTDEDLAILDMQQKLKTDRQSKLLGGILISLIAVMLVFIGVYIALTDGGKAYPDRIDNNVADAGIKYYSDEALLASLKVNTYMQESEYPQGILDKYKAIYSVNSDLVGWLKVPNTSIDCGVYQAADNDAYHRTDIYGNHDSRGSAYADYRAVLNAGRKGFVQNTVVYGHHLTSNEMVFAEVEKYRDVEFYKTAPVIEFGTIYEDIKWKVLACFVSTADPAYDNGYLFYYPQPTMSAQCFTELLSEIKKRSCFINESVWNTVDNTDRLLMLSTCTYSYYTGGYEASARCVLVCVMMDANESSQIDVSGAYANPNIKQSQVWYDINKVSNPYANDKKWFAY